VVPDVLDRALGVAELRRDRVAAGDQAVAQQEGGDAWPRAAASSVRHPVHLYR
jgi:hypothetical protein